MTTTWPFAEDLLAGPLCSMTQWPYNLHACCCDLRPRFLVKQTIRSGCRAVSRNGRVLLCADRPVEELSGRFVRVRLQTWHRSYLPGDVPQPHGVLLYVRSLASDERKVPVFEMHLRPLVEAKGELRIAVGGGIMLDFFATSKPAGERDGACKPSAQRRQGRMKK